MIYVPHGTEMFHFPWLASCNYEFITGYLKSWFPNSEISGSKCVCHSPKLIAAYHVLHRLPVPRHPPCALTRLISCVSVLIPRHYNTSLVSFQRASKTNFEYRMSNNEFRNSTFDIGHSTFALLLIEAWSAGDFRDLSSDPKAGLLESPERR